MLRTLIIGLGRAGAGLHLTVLRKLRPAWEEDVVFDPAPVIAVDPRAHALSVGPDVRVTASLAEAARLLDPARTVVHVCTPPIVRLELLRELAELGFRNIIMEKPITTDRATLAAILNLADAEALKLAVVAPWLASALTARLSDLVAKRDPGPVSRSPSAIAGPDAVPDATAGTPKDNQYSRRTGGDARNRTDPDSHRTGTSIQALGALRSIEIHQSKPRLNRSLATAGHPTAFDIEPPHSLGVCLRLAGPARLVDARLSDMTIGSVVIPNMGSAELMLQHDSATTRIVSDLESPVRERRIELDFDGGHVIGHYPGSEDDHYAHLHVAGEGRPPTREVFPDDALTAYVGDTYRGFLLGDDFRSELAIGCQVVELIAEAKDLCLTGTEAASVG